jgi:glycosidase
MEFAAGLAAAHAGNNEIVCKVTSWEEFWQILDKYVKLASDPKAKLIFANEERLKVYSWLQKQQEDFKDKATNGSEEELQEIANLLHKFDTELK